MSHFALKCSRRTYFFDVKFHSVVDFKGFSQLMRTSAATGNFLVKVDYVLRFGNAS